MLFANGEISELELLSGADSERRNARRRCSLQSVTDIRATGSHGFAATGLRGAEPMLIVGSPFARHPVLDMRRPGVQRLRKGPHAPSVKGGVAAALNSQTRLEP